MIIRLGIDPAMIDMIKVDVEGHEFEVFEGAKGVLCGGRASVLFEASSTELLIRCISLLKKAGYDNFRGFSRCLRSPYVVAFNLETAPRAEALVWASKSAPS